MKDIFLTKRRSSYHQSHKFTLFWFLLKVIYSLSSSPYSSFSKFYSLCNLVFTFSTTVILSHQTCLQQTCFSTPLSVLTLYTLCLFYPFTPLPEQPIYTPAWTTYLHPCLYLFTFLTVLTLYTPACLTLYTPACLTLYTPACTNSLHPLSVRSMYTPAWTTYLHPCLKFCTPLLVALYTPACSSLYPCL